MTPGNNGASTPEDDDPFGYLYADGQASGATRPGGGGGYGYPNSVNRVRAVGERQYGQQAQTAHYARAPQQHGQYGRPNAHYAAPETLPGGAPPAGRAGHGSRGGQGGGRGRGPNTKGLLIGAIAVVAAVVVGISIAMVGGDDSEDGKNTDAAPSAPADASGSAEPSASTTRQADDDAALPVIDAKALQLQGATTASDVPGAKADGGVYVTNFNQVGASVTWKVDDVPQSGKYTLYVGYGVPGKDGTATLTVNGKANTTPLGLKNWAGAPEGDYEKGWTQTYSYVELDKGSNTIKVSCEQGNQCDANLDRLWLEKGWKK
ncbi:hypothetical protein GCM10010358_17520 [Streptomyces minutiscleroticus]|uniref:CBM6 domain-containing protein n=1 Tax=Streptomyces minutiscleroticus TaxID=68238 RepID=A0A918KJR7_9ACTN|nr:CBM35 domain-containing protein [Streptomyces minutiscleroticus]GGX63611.1 hypothetical protein GCM10010358_17520 [Streptomyces minutiscleroticus]